MHVNNLCEPHMCSMCRFKDEERAGQLGFNFEYSYPVYQIDVTDQDDGGRDAAFLLADGDGQFKWVGMDNLNRSKPPTTRNRPHSGHNKDSRDSRDKRGSRSEPRSGPNPYGNSILGGRHDDGPEKSGNR